MTGPQGDPGTQGEPGLPGGEGDSGEMVNLTMCLGIIIVHTHNYNNIMSVMCSMHSYTVVLCTYIAVHRGESEFIVYVRNNSAVNAVTRYTGASMKEGSGFA